MLFVALLQDYNISLKQTYDSASISVSFVLIVALLYNYDISLNTDLNSSSISDWFVLIVALLQNYDRGLYSDILFILYFSVICVDSGPVTELWYKLIYNYDSSSISVSFVLIVALL